MADSPTEVIIDCDPGLGVPYADIDDNLAVLLALANESLDVKLISVVSGNTPVAAGASSMQKTLEMVHRTLEVTRGAARPLVRPYVAGCDLLAHTVRGASLDLPRLIDSSESGHECCEAFAKQVGILEASKKPVTIIAVGPLTNIGLLLQQRPDLCTKIDSLVIMGGAINHRGNVSPFAEFNVWVDPEAARIVFRAPVRKVLASLDVTTTVELTPAEISTELPRQDKTAEYLMDGVKSWASVMEIMNGSSAFNPHDPIAVAYLIAPEIFESTMMSVSVDVSTGKTLGIRNPDGDTRVLTAVDEKAFKELFFSAVSKMARQM